MCSFSYLLPYLFFATIAADPYDDPNTLPNRQVMVQLFEWKWKDIAAECENFLWRYGYGAVQVSPPNEHLTLTKNNDMPWWIRYQPVSYKLNSRSGTEEEFKDMVERCNKVGVRIIVDAVINNMAKVGLKKGIGSSGGSYFDGTEGIESFPEVPYTKEHFNDYRCKRNIIADDIAHNVEQLRNCRNSGLLDLDQSNPHVQAKIVEYFNHLIDIGVAGFRIDSKYMWPKDLKAIQSKTKNLRIDIFGPNKRPFFAHVINENGFIENIREYKDIGRSN
ncbi:unnamed protein product [Strongylus vulgaris]|uniref:alpha-amylase n=1 Tax=Strongylus vulgaris TaxID=40348 RepID=A0A3P7IGH2_STRVU|nr:unnamed protein product [Strongylus vulgaris]